MEYSTWFKKYLRMAKNNIKNGRSVEMVLLLRQGYRTEIRRFEDLQNRNMLGNAVRSLIINKKPDEYLFMGEYSLEVVDSDKNIDDPLNESTQNGEDPECEADLRPDSLIIFYGMDAIEEMIGVIKYELVHHRVIFSKIEWLPGKLECDQVFTYPQIKLEPRYRIAGSE